MGSRGRKSASELGIVAIENARKSPAPPSDLTPDEAALWERTAATEAPNFFRTAAAQRLLTDYCKHCAAADMVSDLMNKFEPDWFSEDDGVARFDKLSKIRDREGRAAADKAVKLRLTNQSRYTPQRAGTMAQNQPTGPKPWDSDFTPR